MKAVASILIVFLFVGCANSAKKETPNQPRKVASSADKYLNDKDMKVINLTNIAIIDRDNNNIFPYSAAPLTSPSKALLDSLLKTTGDNEIVSGIFSAQSLPTFKNIYVFVSKEILDPYNSKYKLNVVYENSRSRISLIDYDIVGTSQRELGVVNGPSDELEKYIVRSETSLFPY